MTLDTVQNVTANKVFQTRQTFTPSTNLNAILAVSGQTSSVIKGQNSGAGYAIEGIGQGAASAIRANNSGTGACMDYATTNGRVRSPRTTLG